jgi:hypothetical protein
MEHIIKCSLGILGIYLLFQAGNLLYPIRAALKKRISTFFLKPIFECLTCMASFWGFLYWVTYVLPDLANVTTLALLKSILITILPVCGLNFLLDKFISFFPNRVKKTILK